MSTIAIDTNVTFSLPNGRSVTVDALELEEFVSFLFDSKGEEKETKDPDGSPKKERVLPWETIITDLSAWVKEKTGVEIKKSEAVGIWKHAPGVWAKKNASWDAPAADSPDSPNSPATTDPRYAD